MPDILPATLDTAIGTLHIRGASKGEYGDGSDGTVTLGVNTTLARDTFYDVLTTGAFTLTTAGFRVLAKTSITVSSGGAIVRNGNAGVGAVGGAALAVGSSGASGVGGAGSTGVVAGTVGGTTASSAGAAGGAGGTGAGAVGGAAGAATAPTAALGGFRFLPPAITGMVNTTLLAG